MTHDNPEDPEQGATGDGGPRHPTLMRLLEQAREQRGSPSLWDEVAARLDSEDRERDFLTPMRGVLDQIRERVDDETWRLVLDFEWRSLSEIMAGVEVGLDLGYSHGRAAALVDAEHIPGDVAGVLAGRLTDLLGDTQAGPFDVLLTLLSSLRATVLTAREALVGQR
ncbi:hypothetical protein [Paraliomyxa miuraensis]|uniref:hypothetical protein n=1 Tax=Paraliomyxa miuraensis TaxID=376150 RepID=UPI00224E4A70|nr:hypothetical protein [Paraliomyxa miuraensis]MCX4239759.1 hypothetical protein [Paraliomyxa miuraensis]